MNTKLVEALDYPGVQCLLRDARAAVDFDRDAKRGSSVSVLKDLEEVGLEVTRLGDLQARNLDVDPAETLRGGRWTRRRAHGVILVPVVFSLLRLRLLDFWMELTTDEIP